MILVVDNYDSFTYNLVQYLGQLGAELLVRRNDDITIEEVRSLSPSGILLSPGPCTPKESGVCLNIGELALKGDPAFALPIFGVCLGHQAIGHVAGGRVNRANRIMHGKTSQVRHDGKGLFEGMPNPFTAVRYHSLVVERDQVPEDFVVTATAEDDGEIMGLRHVSKPIESLQFHPESVLTQDGLTIVANFYRRCQEFRGLPSGVPSGH